MPIIQAPKLKSIDLGSDFVINEMELHARLKQNVGENGLKVKRLFTEEGQDPFAEIDFDKRISKITNPDGSTVFEMKDVEVPKDWSQVATDVLAQKYLRKKGVPQFNKDGSAKMDADGNQVLGGETSIKQVALRLAGTWRHWGEKYNYFETEEDAQAFEDEAAYMIVQQIAVPNSPQWFNTGLAWAYGITGEAQGHYYVDPDTGKLSKSTDAYTRPQPHACFIQEVRDDLVNEGGIFDLVLKEARLFKYGSGTGTNFSKVRGKNEPISGGGVSSGLMSFLKVLDAGAGSIKSGGTTRRAAKMDILDVDHPDIEEFINWKVREEQKVADLVTGSHINFKYLKEIMQLASDHGIDPDKNPGLKKKISEAKRNFVPLNYVKRVLMLVENGMTPDQFSFDKFDTDFRSEAYTSVDGQNSNNSVRVTQEFLEAVVDDKDWNLVNRIDGKIAKTLKARDIWDQINYAAWGSADPGIQYHTTVNEWNTCLNDGEIVGSNPCSEYMFLDETACNLYQINLISFYDSVTGKFDTEMYEHVVRISTIILEVSVLMSQLPSSTMAAGTFKYRTLGLGYANLGTVLMQMGIPYDSEEGFAITAAITGIMGGEAYATSAEMAKVLGTFERYDANEEHMQRVIRNHRRAIYSADDSDYEQLTVTPFKFREELVPENLRQSARASWDFAQVLGEEYGFRNAHVTCLAPTGTTGLVLRN
jgi:ribonucleoside-diphosphate reductase alpha chain